MKPRILHECTDVNKCQSVLVMSRQTPNPVACAVRCGMIYMEAHQLGWKPLKDSYMDTLPSSLTKEHEELVRVWDTPFLHSPSTPDSLLI